MDKILELFFKEPEREFHVREIARIVGKSPTTVAKRLREREEEGVLSSQGKLNHLFFKANSRGLAFLRRKLSYNLEIIESSGLIEYLEEEFNHPEVIGLFGSFAKAENVGKSDVDIFVVCPLKKNPNLEKFRKKIGHEIQLFVFSREDIKKMRKENKGLLNSLINGIVLVGHFEVLR